jgi:GT2 family glycosyltransferase
MAAPAVTVAVLNYQRKETLRRALERALAQRYSNLEVLVVDNASTDGGATMVEREFPSVRLVSLPTNVGCAARNAGVAAAKGEIVVTLDNDVLLTDRDDVARVVEIFATHPSAACVNFKILAPSGALSTRDWCHPRDWRRYADQEFVTYYVLEGASAHRREAFERAGGYWAPLFLGHEGLDLGLRLLDAGHELLYSPRVSVMHLVSSEARPTSRIHYTFTRNAVWVALRNHRPRTAAWAITRDLLLTGFSAARAGHLGAYLRGVADAVKGTPRALQSRRVLRGATYRHLGEIRRLEPSIVEKVKRHWRERPIA